jgi:hypothetical protein
MLMKRSLKYSRFKLLSFINYFEASNYISDVSKRLANIITVLYRAGVSSHSNLIKTSFFVEFEKNLI